MPRPSVQSSLTVLDLPASERPRERLVRLGAEALSDQELVCCLLGRGIRGESVLVTAQRLLKCFGTLRGVAEASVEQLAKVRGVGTAKAAQLKAAAELTRRMANGHGASPRAIETAEQAAAVLAPVLRDKKKEHFVVLLLDNRHRLIRLSPVAVGSLSASVVHPRELFKDAIAASAAAVILAHNHPSGDPAPSDQDIALTKRLVQAGALLGIEVLDHLILGAEGVVSLTAMGVISRRGGRPRS
jgi:DNA repair protein RadC